MAKAAGRGRVPGGKGIYITEFGYQTNPPDRISTITPKLHARYINESDRLFYGDSRIKTVAQYQLVDVATWRSTTAACASPGTKEARRPTTPTGSRSS